MSSVARALRVVRKQGGGPAEDDVDPMVSMGGQYPQEPTSPVEAARSVARTVAPNIYEAVAGKEKPIAPLPEHGKVPSTGYDYGPAAIEGLGFLPGPEVALGKAGALAAAGLIPRAARAAETKLSAEQGGQLFKRITGRDYGSAPTDLQPMGRGDMVLPPGVTPKDFHQTVNNMVNDIKKWNNPQRRYWYENSGRSILTSVGNDPELADRVTATVAKTSQTTPVLDNAAYTAKGHNQAMLGEPINTGRYPNDMRPFLEKYYHEPQTGVIGPKITGYQSGFRTAWSPVLNQGANDIHNMRWLGWHDFDGSPTTGQHNYDRMVRSAVTDRLNAEKFDNGNWVPGQVQAVGWAKTRAASGVPEEEAGYDIAQAFKDRAAQLTYESAPGRTLQHLPEFHNAPWKQRLEYHNAIDRALQDEQGRDLIASHMGLLTMPTRQGMGVFEGHVNPGSIAQVITGGEKGGATAGLDPATRELINASELTRGLLLRQDAVAGHYPAFPKNPNWAHSNLLDVRTGTPMSEAEATRISDALQKETGSTNFPPLYTDKGWRVLNFPDSGLDNKQLEKAVVSVASRLYPGTTNVKRGFADTIYHSEDWGKNNGQGYLEQLRRFRPDVQRRVSEALASLGPRISKVEEDFAKRYGWTPDRGSRVWERNPAYQTNQAALGNIPIGKMPHPWEGQKRSFFPDLLKARGGRTMSRIDRALRVSKAGGGPTVIHPPAVPTGGTQPWTNMTPDYVKMMQSRIPQQSQAWTSIGPTVMGSPLPWPDQMTTNTTAPATTMPPPPALPLGNPVVAGSPSMTPQPDFSAPDFSNIGRALNITKQHGGPAALPLTGSPGEGAMQAAYQGPIKSHVPGRTDRHEMDVKSGSYVLPADVVSIVGQGNSEAGNNIFKMMMMGMPKPHPGIGASLQKMPPLQLHPHVMMKHAKETKFGKGKGQGSETGGGREVDGGGTGLVPIIAAGGEHVIAPEDIINKFGDLDHGHQILDLVVKKIRKQEIERLKTAPPPKK